MRSRIAAIVMLSTVVFFVVSLLVSLGLWRWSGDLDRGVFIVVICGAAAAFAAGAVGMAVGRSGERSSDEHKRSRDGHDRRARYALEKHDATSLFTGVPGR